MPLPEVFDIAVTRVHETAKAVKFDDGKSEFWVPKSVMEPGGFIQLEENSDGSLTLTAPRWWLLKQGLI